MILENQKCKGKRFRLCICLGIILSALGCKRMQPGVDQYHFGDIDSCDIVGVWSATKQSLDNLKNEGYSTYIETKDHLIHFYRDGKCTIRTYSLFPAQPSMQEQQNLYIEDQDGTWRIDKIVTDIKHVPQSVYVIKILIQTIDTNNLETSISKKTITFFIKYRDQYELWWPIGDPDRGKNITFQKVLDENNHQ